MFIFAGGGERNEGPVARKRRYLFRTPGPEKNTMAGIGIAPWPICMVSLSLYLSLSLSKSNHLFINVTGHSPRRQDT